MIDVAHVGAHLITLSIKIGQLVGGGIVELF